MDNGPKFIAVSGNAAQDEHTPPADQRKNDSLRDVLAPDTALADYMDAQGYHPVILCGTSKAGKTTLITSLCAYLQTTEVAEVAFGPWEIDGSKDSQDKLRAAKDFFHNTLKYYHHGKTVERTEHAWPYVVPLELTLTQTRTGRGDAKKLRIAFMDIRGEYFKTDASGDADLQPRPLHHDTQALLRAFKPGVSMVYAAPMRMAPNGPIADSSGARNLDLHRATQVMKEKIHEDPDEALVNAITNYKDSSIRPRKQRDRHLYLLTKWDEHTQGIDPVEFGSPSVRDVEAILRREFPRSWSAYCTMQAAPDSKWFMQHSACVVVANTVTHKPSEDSPELARYAEVVWNWLYQGAATTQPKLQGDVMFPRAVRRRPSLLARAIDAVMRR